MNREDLIVKDFLIHLKTEMIRGIVQLLILLQIEREGSTYGYEIIQKIFNDTNNIPLLPETNNSEDKTQGILLKKGTIYPHLNNLEKKGFLKSHWDQNKKLYSLTPLGEKMLLQFKDLYITISDIVKIYV